MARDIPAAIEWVAALFPLVPERGRAIALMFTDLEGFTRHAAGAGNGAAVRLLHRHDRAVLPALRWYRGRIVKRLGDGLMAVFSSPADALVAALVMQAAASSSGLSLRVGLHVGEARVREGDLIGHDVNVASRIADRTPGGAVLVSDAVRAAAGPLAVRFRKTRPLVVGGHTLPLFRAESLSA